MKCGPRDVKITGVSAVTPAGIGRDAFERGIVDGGAYARPITRFGEERGPFVGAPIQNFNLASYVDDPNEKRLSRATKFALAGVVLALSDAGIKVGELKDTVPVLVNGTYFGDFETSARSIESVVQKGPHFVNRRAAFGINPATICTRIVEQLGTPCRAITIATGSCAGLDAIGQGAVAVASGQADIAICCGCEAPLSYHPMLEFREAGLAASNVKQADRLCRPFDLWRTSSVIGEGAGVVVIEPESSPRKGYAWIDGYSFGTLPGEFSPRHFEWAMSRALADAERSADEIDLIFAWGSGHRHLDTCEAAAFLSMFKSKVPAIPVVSLKGAIGDSLGASGAIQVVAAAIALQTGVIPPTVNWEFLDPECPLDLSAKARDVDCGLAMVNAQSFVGPLSSVIMRKA